MADRDLSPYSARRALTLRLNQEQAKPAAPAEQRNGRGRWDRNGPPEKTPRDEHRRSPPKQPKDLPPIAPERGTRDAKSKEPSIKAGSVGRDRDVSPKPYRPQRDPSRERIRDRSRDRDRPVRRDRSRDRDRSGDRHKERRRDRSGERSRDGSRHRRHSSRDRDRARDGGKDRDRDRYRDRSKDRRQDRSKDRRRDRSRERRRDRSRSREREHHRRRDRDHDRDYDRDRRRHRSKERRSRSPRSHRSLKHRSPSSSPPPAKRRRYTRSYSRSRSPRRSKKPLPSQEVSFRGTDNSTQPPTAYGGAPKNIEKPNYKPSGALAKAANKVEGTKISLKYHEPPEARKPPPSAQWRIFVFKGPDVVDTIELHKRSCWLLGRTDEVVDYLLEHPSSSGQHAVIQFRYIQKSVQDEFGVKKMTGKVKPYIIDLQSSNGTELNGERIETSRYYELRDKDILKFAGSEREYVVMLPPKDA